MVGRLIQKCLTLLAFGAIVIVSTVEICFSGERKEELKRSSHLANFLQLVFPECTPEFKEKILALASDPEEYFEAHEEDMGYDKPYEGMYLPILLSEMQEHNKLWTMDRKTGRGEINSTWVFTLLTHPQWVVLGHG